LTPLTPLTPLDTADTVDTADTRQKKVVSKTIDTSNTGFEANNDAAFQSKKDGGVTVSRVSGGVKKDKQTAYRNDLRHIWRDKNIEDLQTTVDALEQVKIEDDAIWSDIVDYLVDEHLTATALMVCLMMMRKMPCTI